MAKPKSAQIDDMLVRLSRPRDESIDLTGLYS